MFRAFIVMLFLLVTAECIYCQVLKDTNYRNVDSATYADYTAGNWENILAVGKLAQKNNIDYFYLRMRLGVANYNLGYFNNSANNFEKALSFNSSDQTAQLYLYNSYLMMGNELKSNKLKSGFSDKTKSLIPDNSKVIDQVYAGGGYLFSNNYSRNSGFQTGGNGDTLVGYKVLIGDKINAYAGLQVVISPTFNFYFGYNHLSIQKKLEYQYREAPLSVDSVIHWPWGFRKVFSVRNESVMQVFDEKIYQNEIYIKPQMIFDKGWSLDVFGNMIFVNSIGYTANRNMKTVVDTLRYTNNSGPEYFTYDYLETTFSSQETNFVDYIIGLSINKDINNAFFSVFGSYSSLNNMTQYQVGGSATYYFNKLATIYGTTGVMFFSENAQESSLNNRLIINQNLGTKIMDKLWGEASFVYGNLNNANTQLGLIVYNQADNISFKAGAKLSMYLSNHFELNLSYSFIAYEGNFIVELPQFNSTHIYQYQSQNIIGGLVWSL